MSVIEQFPKSVKRFSDKNCGEKQTVETQISDSIESHSALDVNSRVKRHRLALRCAGLRPVQIWVTDTRDPDFAAECRRQSLLAAASDACDGELQNYMEAAAISIEGWTS